jgi:H+/Cl- antiporter ClcA
MDAAGSGLPLLKYILSGDMGEEADTHLQARTLLAKVLGLTLAAGAGLSVGREGPNVHIASIVSWLLLKHARMFKGLYRFPSLRRHILDAACAVGVSSTFAAPIGGVLFSIEATTNYYEISNYWKCFMAAVAGNCGEMIDWKGCEHMYRDTHIFWTDRLFVMT